jgi:hypothetical protein
MASTFYVIECRANGIDAEYLINDIPVIRRGDAIGTIHTEPVNHLLIDGNNRISMVLRPGPTPSESLSGKGGIRDFGSLEGKASMRLARYPRGAVAGGPDGVELMRIDWPLSPEQLKKILEDKPLPLFPLNLTVFHDLGQLYGKWRWQSAAPSRLDRRDRDEILELLTKIHTSLAAGDPEPFIEASQVRFQEISRSYEKPPAMKVAQFRQLLAAESREKWWGMQPLTPDLIDLRPVAEGKVVDCVNKDWLPTLRSKQGPDGAIDYFNMMVCKLDNRWQIVR